MFRVVGDLFFAASFGLLDGVLHGVGDAVGVHVHFAGNIAGRATNGLDQGRCGTEKTFFIGIQNGNQGDLGQVKTLAEEVDAHKDVVFAEPELAEQFHPLQGIDVRVEVAHAHAVFQQVVGKIFCHLLGQRGHQHAFFFLHAQPNFVDEVVDLPIGGFDHHFRVNKPGGPNNLFNELSPAGGHFKGAGGGGHKNGLAPAVVEFLPGQRAVIQRRGQAETEVHEVAFAGGIAFVHATDLGHGDVGFVDDQQEVFWEVVNERRGCRSCVAAVDVAGVILNPRAETYLFDHFQVVFGAHAQTLRFQEFAAIFQILQPHGQFRFDGLHRFFHAFRPGNIVRGGENTQFIGLADHVTGEWVDVV